jgi:hypothetical protein
MGPLLTITCIQSLKRGKKNEVRSYFLPSSLFLERERKNLEGEEESLEQAY